MHIRPATLDDIDAIIRLNKKFLIGNVEGTDRKSGFIRIEYTNVELERVVINNDIVVSENNNFIVGYYLIGKTSESHSLEYQKIKARNLLNTHKISFEKVGYGCQVCIDEVFRSNGLFNKMLFAVSNEVKGKYSHLLCSVSDENSVSMKTHLNNGWKIIDSFETRNYLIYQT
jgi:hypothetical protein